MKPAKPKRHRRQYGVRVYLDSNESNQLNQAAAEEGASASSYGRRIILFHLRDRRNAQCNRGTDRSPEVQAM